MKRNRPIFNTLKAAEALEGANFSAEQARQIVLVIQDSQENVATLDDLQESEHNAKAHTTAKRVKPTSNSTLTRAEKRDIFYVALGLSFGVIAFIALSAGLGWMLADIVYHLITR